ncbi:retrotransposon protein, putative, ty1-copia subclass [Tanacetum coccineum]
MGMWSGHPSDYGMLRIFCCVAYPHDKQGKLESRVVKCVLLGYPEGVNGYRLYRLDNESPKIVTSKNAVFNENFMYKDMLKDSGARDKSVEELQSPDLTDYQLARDRERRTRTKPLRFREESNMAAYASKWKDAMEEAIDSLRKNKTWELVDLLAGQKLGSSKWFFKIKEGIKGVQNLMYKARLVAHGFTQRVSIDYNEVFSPVVRHTSIRVILALTACKDYELEELDVKTAFLHGNLEEVIYMRQPPGYEQGNKIGSTKSLLKKEFDMKELEEAKNILGMEIVRDRSCKILRVSQSGYISKILNNFKIDNEISVKMPLGGHFKLSLKDCPVRDYDVERMSKIFGESGQKSLGSSELDFEIFAVHYKRGFGVWDKSWQPCRHNRDVKEAIWLRGLLEELGVKLNTVAVNCDNQGAIHLSQNHVFHERTKHINVVPRLKLQHCLELLNVGVG